MTNPRVKGTAVQHVTVQRNCRHSLRTTLHVRQASARPLSVMLEHSCATVQPFCFDVFPSRET